jgi:hypothetical protein
MRTGYARSVVRSARHFALIEDWFGLRPDEAVSWVANRLMIGAGEGIRTLDPDLGKVVLYP